MRINFAVPLVYTHTIHDILYFIMLLFKIRVMMILELMFEKLSLRYS